jgi:SAM-dependent methyltransferase
MDLENVDCPICGPSQISVWLNDGKLTRYIRCRICGTVYSSPRYIQKIRHAETEKTWSYTDAMLNVESTRRLALKLEAELIQKHVRSGRMLDVGCSAGDFFDFFPADLWERHGVELSASTAAYTSKRYSIPVNAGVLRDAQLASGSFDLVSMIDMFYYADDPLADLVEAKRILKPEGILAIEIAGQAYMFARSKGLIALLLDQRWCRLSSDSHLYWFNPLGLNRLLHKAGFQPFEWYVTPSPRHGNVLIDSLTSLHFSILRSLSSVSLRSLNWAPKYLCLARPMDTHS